MAYELMDRSFIKGGLVEPERMRELAQRKDGPGWRRLLTQSGLYVISAAGMLSAESPWLVWCCFGLNALIQFGMFGMLHESCHQTAFSRRNLNLMAGWVAALGQPMTPALMRAFHFEHHRHTHEVERDPELAGFEWMAKWPRHLMWLLTLSGLPLVMARVGWTVFAASVPAGVGERAWTAVLPFVGPKKRKRIAWEARALLFVHGAIVVSGVLFVANWWMIYLAMLIAHGLLGAYVTCEHRGLEQRGSVLERTRSLKVPAPLRWLLWNMPYHAEHHAWPAVPFHALGRLHLEVNTHLVHCESPLYLHMHHGCENPSDIAHNAA